MTRSGEHSAPPWPLAAARDFPAPDAVQRRLLCTARFLQKQSWGTRGGSGLALALSLAARAHRQGRYIPAGGSKERAARSPFWRGGCTDAIMRPRTTATRKRRPAANRREIVEDRGVSTATSPDLPQLLPKKVVIAVSGRRTTSISASTHARLTGSSSQQNRKPYPAPAMHRIRRTRKNLPSFFPEREITLCL